jgi:hypothetical protein
MSATAQSLPASPQVALYELLMGYAAPCAIYVAVTLGLPDLIERGHHSVDSLAAFTKVQSPELYRLLRLLASVDVCHEEAYGHFTLTPMGRCLVSDAPTSLRSAALTIAAPRNIACWNELLNVVTNGSPAFEKLFGTSPFAFLSSRPFESSSCDDAIASYTSLVVDGLLASYDFTAARTVVDVGGGNGTFMVALLNTYPLLNGVLCELPHVAARARILIDSSALTNRCRVLDEDFFESVPRGGDVYILKHIIHDWNDEKARAVLDNCQRVMTPAARLLILETVLPPKDSGTALSHRVAFTDVAMMVSTGGRERNAREMRSLLEAAHLKCTRIIHTHTPLSIVEAVPRSRVRKRFI